MKRLFIYALAVVATLFVATQASAQTGKNFSQVQVSPFNELIATEKHPVFSYQCFYSWSFLRDWEATATNGAQRNAADDCRLPIETSTQTDSVYRYETVDFGIYEAGLGAESGIAMFPDVQPTGDAVYRVGLGDTDDGAFFELHANGVRFVIVRDGVRVFEQERENWTIDTLDGDNDRKNPSGVDLDFYNDGYITKIYWSWYSVGKICGGFDTPGSDRRAQMETIIVTCWVPGGITSLDNPNLPVFTELDNNTSGQQLSARIGGRRYYVLGEVSGDPREVSAYRSTDVTAPSNSTLTPIICVRRKPDWPSAGEQNTLTIAIVRSVINTTGLVQIGYYTVDSITGTWVSPDGNYPAAQTGTQFSKDVSAMTNPILISDFALVSGTQSQGVSNPLPFESAVGKLIRSRPTCLAARSRSGTNEDVEAGLTVGETW